MNPKISIVIPSYNKVKYISKTLSSIVNQDYDNYEVIVQDGNSDDGTLKIIKDFAKKHPKNIKYYSANDNGQLDAINKGMSKATGEIFTFINADDMYFDGTFISVSAAYLENPEHLWFAGKGIVVDLKDKEIAKVFTYYKNLLLKLNLRSLLLITNYLMQPSVFITKEAYKKYGPFDGNSDFVMEYELWLKLARFSMPLVINKNLTKFRIEPDTKTKRMFVKLLSEDENIVRRETSNIFILVLHKLHNIARILVERFLI